MIAFAWLLSIAAVVWAYIVSLAGAMRTVPRLYWGEAMTAVPLPLVAGTLAAWCMLRPIHPPQTEADRPFIAAGIPLLLAVLALLIVAVSYLDQPGGPA